MLFRSPVIEESPAIKIIEQLIKAGVKVIAYDPLAINNTKAVFGDKIEYAASAKDALGRVSCAIITTREPEFINLTEEDVVHNPTVIIDCWRVLDQFIDSPKVKYIGLGKY